MNNERLGHILLQQGVIDVQELDFCLSVQKNNGRQRLGQLLCYYNFTDERSIAQAAAQQVGWPLFEGDYIADEDMVGIFGKDFLVERLVFPVRTQDGIVFVLAKANDTQTTDVIIHRVGGPVLFALGIEKSLRAALSLLSQKENSSMKETPSDQLNDWFDGLLNRAVLQSASDIHIEPSVKVIELRFRIDGILQFVDTLPLKCLPRLMNIVFHKADVTISDFGHFHDAKFVHKYLNRSIDVRVSHIPSIDGSALVLRLLDKSRAALPLSALGYGAEAWQKIQKGLKKPDGMVLVVGPTGCGKTTTLYAMLNDLKSINCKIVTIEDPVEIHMPLLTQVQVNERREIDFPNTVRAFLRHDPDIVLIGEIRDRQTAQEALRAAMTGHQVFSTLHTNKALDVFLRLNDLGLPFSHMADHVSMVIAQRLVRKRYADGFKGQTVVAEVLVIDEAVSEYIAKGDLIGLKKFLKDSAHQTMKDDGMRLVKEGITTQEEIERVLG